MDDRELYKEKARAKLDELDARIDVLKAQAAGAKADAHLKVNKELENLRGRRDDLNNEVAKLQESTADAWSELRAGFNRALGNVQDALDRAGRELRGER
jgi:chromosome segregation ATPase